MARPRTLPPGIRPRGKSFVYDWRDATGKTFSRKAGDTVDEAIAFKAKIDAELATGTFVAGSKTTFAEYAAHWIETYPHQVADPARLPLDPERTPRAVLRALPPREDHARARRRVVRAAAHPRPGEQHRPRARRDPQEHPQDRPGRRAPAVPADDRAPRPAADQAPAEGADVQAGVGARHGRAGGMARTVRDRDAFVTHPVKAARVCERLALLGLLRRDEGDKVTAEAITDYLDAFLSAHPAVAHVISDEWGFSLLAAVTLLLAQGRRDTARLVLRPAAVWLLDKFEFGSGVAGVGMGPADELRQLLGPAYQGLRPPPAPSSYSFTVILDLAHLAGFRDLYEDLLNDLHAVEALACIVLDRGDDAPEYVARLEYSLQDDPPAVHHGVPATALRAGAAEAWFDCLATWATLRDRHLPSVIARVVDG